MCKVQMLRALVEQRLTAAAEEIFGLFERTIAEYEEELCRSKEENERQRELLDAVFNPQLRVHRADVQQLLVVKEEVPLEQQECSSRVDQQEPEPPPHIKEEQEEWWSSQEAEQLQGLEKADITKFPFTPVSLKSQDDEEEDVQQVLVVQEEVPPEQQECSSSVDRQDPEPLPHIKEEQEEPRLKRKTDVEQLLVVKEDIPPEQQEYSSSVDQEEPEAPPHIKEEQEELWSSQVGEQLQGLEEAGITKFPFTPVPVKSEGDEEEAQSSQLHQRKTQHMETAAEKEDCEGPEPARNSHPFLQPQTKDQTGDSAKLETEDSAYWNNARQLKSALNSLKHDSRCKKRFSCSECGTRFGFKSYLKKHMMTHTGEKPFCCSVCKKSFTQSGDLQKHIRTHTGEKPFSCSVCNKSFTQSGSLRLHMVVHTGEKRFSCSVCNKRFVWRSLVKTHKCVGPMETEADGEDCGGPEPARNSHPLLQPETKDRTGDSFEPETDDSAHWKETREPQSALNSLKHDSACRKTFSCSECEKKFDQRRNLKRHMMTHTGEKPFCCSVCKKSFTQSGNLQKHMRTHTGEKPFSCLVCNKSFTQSGSLQTHMVVHTGEKRFSCSVCNKRFVWRSLVKRHKCIGPMETEADGEDCGGPEPAWNSHPLLQPDTGDQTGDSSDP